MLRVLTAPTMPHMLGVSLGGGNHKPEPMLGGIA